MEVHLHILPPAQRSLWPDLVGIPDHFVLYGGTAVALRCGHRTSRDFDFFSSVPFAPGDLRARLIWLEDEQTLQSKANTLTVVVDRGVPVKVSFFGGLHLGRVGQPERTPDGVLRIASLHDLAATKAAVIQQRAEKRDYLDLAALLQAGVRLADALGGASALYGEMFNAMISLNALSYFKDGDLSELGAETQTLLAAAAAAVRTIPAIRRSADEIG